VPGRPAELVREATWRNGMSLSAKSVIKQLIPPVVLSIRRALFPKRLPSLEGEAQRALKAAHDRRNQGLSEDEICIRDGLVLKLHPGARVPIEAFCFLYPEMVEELDRFRELTADKRALLDVGALHGTFSLVFSAADPSKTCVAVDASPIAFARLLYNVNRNKLSNANCVECALSDEPGVARMHYEWEHAVIAGTGVDKSTGISVEKKTGDELCASLNFEPDVIKIDVEGHELKVLKGLRQTLSRNRPMLFLEVHPGRIREEGDRLEDLAQIFTDLGYRSEFTNGQTVDVAAIPAFTTDQRLVLLPSG
jgi:FkbM family methyltransferase